MAEQEELKRAIAALEAQRLLLGDDVVDILVAAAREKLAALEARHVAEQRKQVTVLFADVSDFTSIAEAMDHEEVRDTMNALWTRLDGVIRSYGGVIDKHMGDSVMAIFGAPISREDDPERAVRAGLAMQREIKKWQEEFGKLEAPLSIRVGIHTGPVVLGAVGTTSEYTAMGDTVNLASRLQEAAPVGGVLISHDTYRHVRGLFSVWMMEPIAVRGRAETVPIYVVLRPRPRAFRLASRGVEGLETRMVGREEEMAQLQDALRTVIERRESQIISIIGEAGVGKSRLLYEFDNWIALLLEKISLFKGRADEKMSNLPYFLFRDLFSFRFEIQDNDPAALAREKLEYGITELMGAGGAEEAHFVGHLLGFDFSASPYLRGILGDTRQIRDRAFYYVARFFTTAAQQNPTVIFLEDTHWASDGSLDLIDHLARECRQVPLLIVCTARPTLLERRPSWGERLPTHVFLHLEPLSEQESHQLVGEILRKVEEIPPQLLDISLSRAEGNPFFIEEFIKVLIEDHIIVTGPDRWWVDTDKLADVRVPSTMVGVLQARLDRLQPDEREVLQRASVVGRTFWEGAIMRICEGMEEPRCREEVQSALQTLCDKEFIFRQAESTFAGEREYAFKHAILRDVTYESVLRRLRRQYHAQVAAWLFERSGERVGEYAGLIGEHYEHAEDWAQAAGWYGRAGSQARSAYAPEEAIRYYQKALALLQPDAQGGTLSTASAEAFAIQQIVLYEGLGEMLLWQARYPEAVEAYTAMRTTAEKSGDSVAQARAWNKLARAQDFQGDYLAAMQSASRAEEIAQQAGGATRMELARALFRKGWGAYRLGDTEAALDLGRQSLALSTELGARREMADSMNLLGGVYSALGNHGGAAIYNARAVSLYQELGDQEGIATMLNHQGDHALTRGDYQSAAALYQEALKIAYETGNRNGEMASLSNLGGARVGQGEYRIAEYDLRRTIRWAEIIGQGGWLSNTYRFLAEACIGQNKVDDALSAALRALKLGEQVGAPALVGAAQRTLGMVLTLSAQSLTVADSTYTAPDCFAESARRFAEIGNEGERARTLRAWARYEMEQGDRQRGEALWYEAREIFRELGMKLEVERMKNWYCGYPGEKW